MKITLPWMNACLLFTNILWMSLGACAQELFIKQNTDSGTISIYDGSNKLPALVQNAIIGQRPFIHPIMAPDGNGELTQYRPAHHPHQTGLYWGLKMVNGRDFFMKWQDDYWRKKSSRVMQEKGKQVKWQTVYDLLDEKGNTTLTETSTWSLEKQDGKFILDLEWKGEAGTDITFGKFYVGGLFLRMPWTKDTPAEVVNSNGQRNAEAEGKRALWTDVGMAIKGRSDWGHITIMDHPTNHSFPNHWRVDGELGVGPSRQIAGDWKLKKGEIEVVRYRLLIYTGTLAHEQIMNEWKKFSSSQDGWQVLFNGKDFTGWRELNGKHKWEVRDGAIVGTDVHGQPNGFMCTEQEFEDFILEMEVSIDTLMNNSGIQFRTTSSADYLDGRVHGYQMEIDPKPQRWSGGIYEEGGTRHWLYTTELNPSAKKAFKNNEWNKYRIECIGNTIRTWVNGVPVAHLIDNKFPKGFIGLQLHANNPDDPPGGNEVRFRNIRIKTTNLKPSPLDDVFVVNRIPNNLSAQEKTQGYELLWNGKGSDFKSEKQYRHFILKYEFKREKQANSSVEYFVDSARSTTLNKFFYQEKKGEWNEGMIKVLPNNRIEYWLNGFKMLEFDARSAEYSRWLAENDFVDLPAFGKRAKGHIVIKAGKGEVMFHSLKIKELVASKRR